MSDKSVRVLVIDDDSSILKLIGVLLEREGLEAIFAETAREAATILREDPLPDIVLLDVMLPEISGIDFLRQMREKDRFQALPVIILSALADPQTIREGLDAGADRYLTKPYLAKNLVNTVLELVKTGRRKPS